MSYPQISILVDKVMADWQPEYWQKCQADYWPKYAHSKTEAVADRLLIKTLKGPLHMAYRDAPTLYPHLGEQIPWAERGVSARQIGKWPQLSCMT
ncbi:hypothetical protein K4A76_01380 [Pseudomonas sp. NEEL19]|uniref:hypothetical protein n=1 Tax=Pseudomonas sp. NEEL19 TaxID=2867409 RepID=UPI0023682F7B|nr:hypothetical protein [Pseudomonas sp. NEEL19]WDM59643.1 hypothetical protein K4A76_01380 [Pseudomonas sp. NEEL19]